MKNVFTVILCIFSFYGRSQVFTGSGGPIQNLGQETYFNLTVSGLSQAQLNNVFGIAEVYINITHPAVEELYIYLESPGGSIVELTDGNSCKGANYTGTYFSNNAATSVTLASAPYSGNYKPMGFLGRFNNGQAGNGNWTLIVKDYLAFGNSGSVISWNVKFSSSPVPPLVFSSSDLPLVVINTNSQTIGDTAVLVSMGIIYNGIGVRNYLTDPSNSYNGKAKIKFRGNTSKNFEKKPYGFETSDNAGVDLPVSLLGMPRESDWILLAMYQDKSLIRVPLTYDLSRRMGHYAARSKNVEVVINNEYQGMYALMEQPKRDSARIDVSKLTPLENTAPAITGGYIMKIDRADSPGWNSLLAGDASNGAHFFYQYVYPKDSIITVPQRNYIKSFVDSFETAMGSSYFADPLMGYKKYIATPSFIDYFIINELSKNVDAYRLSTYLYKNNISKGGKLHIGPVWDYDLAWHNCNYSNSFDPTGWQYQLTDTTYPTPTWWNRFMQDTSFVNALYCRWHLLRQGILSTNYLHAYVDSSALALNESQQRNFIQWPILGAYISPNPQNQIGANYQSEVTDLKNWTANRAAWMDWAIQGSCSAIGMEESRFNRSISVYPNPFVSTCTFSLHLTEGADVSLKIINVLGDEVVQLLNEYKPAGEFRVIFNRMQTPAGIYFYQLNINNTVSTHKIIIQ